MATVDQAPRSGKTIVAHHPYCPAEQAFDIPEAYDHCSCPAFWPRRVCVECWQPPKRHGRSCSLARWNGYGLDILRAAETAAAATPPKPAAEKKEGT